MVYCRSVHGGPVPHLPAPCVSPCLRGIKRSIQITPGRSDISNMLNCHRIFFKCSIKVLFSLLARPLTPPPPSNLNGLAISEGFFCEILCGKIKSLLCYFFGQFYYDNCSYRFGFFD